MKICGFIDKLFKDSDNGGNDVNRVQSTSFKDSGNGGNAVSWSLPFHSLLTCLVFDRKYAQKNSNNAYTTVKTMMNAPTTNDDLISSYRNSPTEWRSTSQKTLADSISLWKN